MKDAYYFKHDSNARHDPKIIALRSLYGMAGVGRWWCIVEILREQSNYTLDISNKYNRAALKRELEFTDDEPFNDFIRELLELGLLYADNGCITSLALQRRMNQLDKIREKRRESGKLGGRPKKANAFQIESKPKAEQKHLPTYLEDLEDLKDLPQTEISFEEAPIGTIFTLPESHKLHGTWFKKVASTLIEPIHHNEPKPLIPVYDTEAHILLTTHNT